MDYLLSFKIMRKRGGGIESYFCSEAFSKCLKKYYRTLIRHVLLTPLPADVHHYGFNSLWNTILTGFTLKMKYGGHVALFPTKQSDFHCDDCARMEIATSPNLTRGDDKRRSLAGRKPIFPPSVYGAKKRLLLHGDKVLKKQKIV